MDKFYRKIVFNSGSSYNLNIILSEKYDLIGMYNIDETSENLQQYYPQYLITGSCENRLTEIETYDIQRPYIVGINGVTEINSDSNDKIIYIIYIIDGFTYKTFFDDDLTSYYSYLSSSLNSDTANNYSVIKSDKTLSLTQIKVQNEILIDRFAISTFDKHYRLSNMKNLSDITNYMSGNGFNLV